MRFCVALASILASTGSSAWRPLTPSVDDANFDEELREKVKHHVETNKMQNGRIEEDEDLQEKDHSNDNLLSVELFHGCDPSTTATTATTATATATATSINSFVSSTRKEEIDNGHLRHHNHVGSCSAPGEVCFAKTHPAVAKIVDALTQQEDTLYDEGLCVYISYFKGEQQKEMQQQETLIDHSGDGGSKNDDDGKEDQRQQLENEETDITADTALTQVHYYHASINEHEEYNHGLNANMQSYYYYQNVFDYHHVSHENRRLTSHSASCSVECPIRPKVEPPDDVISSLVRDCYNTTDTSCGGKSCCPDKFKINPTFPIPVGCWNVSNVTDMNKVFYSILNFNSPLKCWDVSQVTTMKSLFFRAYSFNQNINEWNVGKVTNMNYMFENAEKFDQNINGWNVGHVTSMKSMFFKAVKFNSSLNDWDVSSVLNMQRMLSGNKSKKSNFNQPIDVWNVTSVNNMKTMLSYSKFNQCLSTWASKTNCPDTNTMLLYTGCPNKVATPNCNEGPWCQFDFLGCVLKTNSPSSLPSVSLSAEPSLSYLPSSLSSSSQQPSAVPSTDPSSSRSSLPSTSQLPSVSPNAEPSLKPSVEPSTALSVSPSAEPSLQPSVGTSSAPSASLSAEPSVESSTSPSISPSAKPSLEPSASVEPSNSPSTLRSFSPSAEPSLEPSASVEPSNSPSSLPSDNPSVSGAPSTSPTVDCSDEEDFHFLIQKKSGIIKDFGGCSSFVAKKPKKRCKKKIHGQLVAFSCPVTCRKCTCEDQKTVTFKFGRKKKEVTRMCENLDRGKFCRIPEVQFACPTRCRVKFCHKQLRTNLFDQGSS